MLFTIPLPRTTQQTTLDGAKMTWKGLRALLGLAQGSEYMMRVTLITQSFKGLFYFKENLLA